MEKIMIILLVGAMAVDKLESKEFEHIKVKTLMAENIIVETLGVVDKIAAKKLNVTIAMSKGRMFIVDNDGVPHEVQP